MLKSIQALRQLARSAVMAFLIAPAAFAQSRVTTPVAVLTSPNGRAIGSLHPGVVLKVIETRGKYAKVSVDGFVERGRLSAQKGKASPRVGNRIAVLRSTGRSSAKSVASLDAGTTVAVSSKAGAGAWVRVTREGWVLKSALQTAGIGNRESGIAKAAPTKRVASKPSSSTRKASAGEVAPAPKRAAAEPPTRRPESRVAAEPNSPESGRFPIPDSRFPTPDSALVPTSNVALRAAPDARPIATIAQGTSLVPLARDRGWVRVRLEGWVPEKDMAPADTSVRSGVSAADLRADAHGAKGKMLRWSVQILATQKADALRKDLEPDETYLLARGPYEENALLYLVVPPALMSTVKSIPELSQAMITARVRTGKSDLVGVPILDLVSITPRK